jgi:glutamine amidotransferase
MCRVIGICVGMQMLASGSDEGELSGLNWVQGRVKAFASTPASKDLPMPHMGWNDIQARPGHKLFTDFEPEPLFIFCIRTISMRMTRLMLPPAEYGVNFDCIVSKGEHPRCAVSSRRRVIILVPNS